MSKVTLAALQSKLANSVPPEECEPYFTTWEKLKENGEKLIIKLEGHLGSLNGDLAKLFHQ